MQSASGNICQLSLMRCVFRMHDRHGVELFMCVQGVSGSYYAQKSEELFVSQQRVSRFQREGLRWGGFWLPLSEVRVTVQCSDILFPYRSPSPRPHPDPTQHPETDPKRSQTVPAHHW